MELESLTVKGGAVARNSTPHPSPGLIHSPPRDQQSVDLVSCPGLMQTQT